MPVGMAEMLKKRIRSKWAISPAQNYKVVRESGRGIGSRGIGCLWLGQARQPRVRPHGLAVAL